MPTPVLLAFPSPLPGGAAAGSIPLPPPPTLSPVPAPCPEAKGKPLGQVQRSVELEGGINVFGGARGGEGGAFVALKIEQHRFEVHTEATLTIFENGACINWQTDLLQGAGEFQATVSLATREKPFGIPVSPSGHSWTESPGPWYGTIKVGVEYTGGPFGGIPSYYGDYGKVKEAVLEYPPPTPTPFPFCTVGPIPW